MKEVTLQEVETFLNEFHELMKIFGIIYMDDRTKNRDSLFELDIVPKERNHVIESLASKDFCDKLLITDSTKYNTLWVFGKNYKKQELYIKVGIMSSSKTICISFHIAEHPMKYKFKNKKK